MDNPNWFRLEFIKFLPNIKKKYDLTYSETLVYWYITEVINFQKNKWNKWVCFTSSKTMWRNILIKPASVDNCVSKLKEKWLIEVQNKFIRKFNRNSRYIYLPWEEPKHKEDKVEYFFYEVADILEDNKKTRAIIWDLIYNKKIDEEELLEAVENLFDYNIWELINEISLRQLYSDFTEYED